MNLLKTIRHTLAAIALGASALASHAAVTTQLGFLVDESGSISAANFNLMRTGYANAFAALPLDGTLEITMYKFGTGSTQVIPPTVVDSVATRTALIALVTAMAQAGGTTNMAAGINAVSAAMIGSGEYSAGLRSIINLATDGAPNSLPDAITAATNARNNGIDALTSEAVAASAAAISNLQDIVFSPLAGPTTNGGVVLPDGSIPPNPMTSLPWVLQVNSFNDFGVAINAKIQAIVNETPEPGALALVGIALMGMALARRRAPVAAA